MPHVVLAPLLPLAAPRLYTLFVHNHAAEHQTSAFRHQISAAHSCRAVKYMYGAARC